MEVLLNAAQMKQCDSDTIHRIGIPSSVLMERAALSVVDELYRHAYDLHSVLVVCGPGNNGGDGFAVARLLDERGVRVTVAFVGRESSMSQETIQQKKICENCGIKTSTNFQVHEYTVIVDAIFGIGLSRSIEGEIAEVIRWVNRQVAVRVAVDIPSGVSSDNGKILGEAIRADLTVTFAYRKLGHILYPGTQLCGTVVRRDIGIAAGPAAENGGGTVFTYDSEDLQRVARRSPYSNKGTYGKVLLVAGSSGMSGAACLAAEAAYRSGSGLVRVFTPECNRTVIQTFLPEAIVTAYDPAFFPMQALTEALDWADVTGIGPGLGKSSTSAYLLREVLSRSKTPVVIDADGLNLLSESMELLEEAQCSIVLTPHIGEMMRLTANTKEEILDDLLRCAKRFAREYRVVCVLKDARTVVTDGKQTYLNTSGNHGMAVGGSGDVLTGIICGLLAQGMRTFDASSLGVYLHGLSGDRASRRNGTYGMIAGDITKQIGQVLKMADADIREEQS